MKKFSNLGHMKICICELVPKGPISYKIATAVVSSGGCTFQNPNIVRLLGQSSYTFNQSIHHRAEAFKTSNEDRFVSHKWKQYFISDIKLNLTYPVVT